MKRKIHALINNCRRRFIVFPFILAAVVLAYAVYPHIYLRYLGWNIKLDVSPDILVGTVTGACALILSAQGFSYLHSTPKVDMYHSLPVSMRDRFRTIYTGGLVFFFISLIIASLMGIVAGIFFPHDTDSAYGVILLKLVLVLLYFLCIYNLTIFSFSITGNSIIAVFVDIILIVYVDLWQKVFDLSLHLDTYSPFFAARKPDISIIDLYFHNISDTGMLLTLPDVAYGAVLRAGVGLIIWFIVTFIAAKRTYVNRPSETSESLIAFYSSHLLIKLMIVVPVSLLMGESLYENFYHSKVAAQIIGMIVFAAITSIIVEFVFTSSMKAAVRSVGSIIFSIFVIFGVYASFRYIENRYDSYIPGADEVESFAIYCPLDCYYYNYNIVFDDEGEPLRYIDAAQFVKDNMILIDTDAILTLAEENEGTDYHDMRSPLPIQIYYRLKNGARVRRLIWVDMDYQPNRTYLNRLMGPAYYKGGIWQVFGKYELTNEKIYSVLYHDIKGNKYIELDGSRGNAIKLIKAWESAMVMYDYDHVRFHETVGELLICFGDGYYKWVLPVYEDMYYNIAASGGKLF